MAHPLSQAEADRVFTDEDRLSAAMQIIPQLKNVQQRERRAAQKAVEAMAAWWSKTGTHEDLLDFEKAAERHQLVARERHGLQAQVRRYLGQ